MCEVGDFHTGVVCRPLRARVSNLYFFLTECVKLAFLFNCMRKEAVSHTACAKVNWSAHARLLRTPCVKQLLCARKTSMMKRRVSHIRFKKKYLLFRTKLLYKKCVYYPRSPLLWFIFFQPIGPLSNIYTFS